MLTVNKNMKDAAIRGVTVTAYLNITYLKPVATPQTVLLTANFRDIKGYKYYIDASAKDGSGVFLAKAEALWIRVDRSKENL